MEQTLPLNRKKRFHIKRSIVVEVISALFIILFVYTAFSKLGNYKGFVSVLSNSPLIGSKAPTIGWLIPAVEILVVALLIIPKTKIWGLYSSTVLMALFTGYIGYMLYSVDGKLPCSCGGVLNSLDWNEHLVFNIFFTMLGFAGILLARKSTNKTS